MQFTISNAPLSEINSDWLVVGIFEDEDLTDLAAELNVATGNVLTRLQTAGDLTGEFLKTIKLYDLPELNCQRLICVGLGRRKELTKSQLRKSFNKVVRETATSSASSITWLVTSANDEISELTYAEAAVQAVCLGTNGQDLYKEKPARVEYQAVTLQTLDSTPQAEFESAIQRGLIKGESINLTRELVNRPAADIYPETVAQRATEIAEQYGFECRVLEEADIQQERMGSLLAVAQGSEKPPRVVELNYRGGSIDSPTLAFIGKGVTFDSGGLSLKPNEGMKTMKCDMAGAATVLGALAAIARLQLPVNVSGYLGLVENMVSGNSYKLGDVLQARNGTTIEVLNTDAEGRLVLADVLCYAVDRGASHLIDLATLTGACVIALGEEITGVFSNQQDWCDQLCSAADDVGEHVWQMPMNDFFSDLLKSDVADCKNVGPRWGGAITAAKFLEKFVDSKPWVHLDIAGPSFSDSNQSHREGGATGCMVQTLVATAEQYPAFQSERIDV